VLNVDVRANRPRGYRTHSACLVTMLVLGLALVACGSTHHATTAEPPAPTGASAHDRVLVQGRALYAAHCAQCHGMSGQGGAGPAFTGGKLVRDFPTVAAQLRFVHKRRIGSALTATQLAAVIRYEREVLSPRS